METKFKCHFCPVCNGNGCISQLPGMGGVRANENFKLNVSEWEKVRALKSDEIKSFLAKPSDERVPKICLAPITGAVENIGYADEHSYYLDIISASHKAGIELSIGDGYPDEKIKYGIEALCKMRETDKESKFSVFIKPYSNSRIIERIQWAQPYANIFGIDIDSYNILTMRNLVNLEKKTADQLIEIKQYLQKLGFPFAIKGIFTEDDIELVKAVHPDIAYISNHGGRVDTRTGSTAEFLLKHGAELKKYCSELWVDGGIRTAADVATAMALGADKILVGRPFVTALCKSGEKGLCEKIQELKAL